MKMYSRQHPYLSYIKERTLLTGEASTKKTYHIVLNWEGDYKVGDSIGILPANSQKEVDLILQERCWNGETAVFDFRKGETVSVRDFLTYRANLARGAKALCPEAFSKEASVRELLRHTKITPEEFAQHAMPMLPRFYSIANSAQVYPGEIHLLVAFVQYQCNGRERTGVTSHFLCDEAEIESTGIPFYVQPSNHFTLPQDSDTSIIMIGPGTGVAPYRAFLQERMASRATGRNWLFFGERSRENDFYYESFWRDLEKQGRLRLDLAFSRDQTEKVYVQHKMAEEAKSLWDWIDSGAHLYVCGDAEKMAKDVDEVLHKIVEECGKFSSEEARLYVKKMRLDKRYLVDVY